jgi:translation elongation factor EF-G
MFRADITGPSDVMGGVYYVLNKTPIDITAVEFNRCENYFQLKD